MVDLALPVTRRGQWEEISFEEVGGVENVPRAIVENALRAFVEDAARRERDRNVRLARKRSIGKRRRELRAALQNFFRKKNWARRGYFASADTSNASCPTKKRFERSFLLVTGLRSISIARITRHGCAKMPCIGITTRGQKGTTGGSLF